MLIWTTTTTRQLTKSIHKPVPPRDNTETRQEQNAPRSHKSQQNASNDSTTSKHVDELNNNDIQQKKYKIVTKENAKKPN